MQLTDFTEFVIPLKTGPYAYMTAADKFWSQVKKGHVDECWLWESNTYNNGYGRFGWRTKGYLAHRVSYWLTNGFLPLDMLVCHKCDNPQCVNPSHLFLGNQKENIADMILKGRSNSARGERSGRSFLSDSQVAEIKWLLTNTSLMQQEIANMYSIPNVNTVSRIKHNKRWQHIAPIEPIAACNLTKLADRANRGVIGGSGDER